MQFASGFRERKREKNGVKEGDIHLYNVGQSPKGVRVHKTPVAPHTPRRLQIEKQFSKGVSKSEILCNEVFLKRMNHNM